MGCTLTFPKLLLLFKKKVILVKRILVHLISISPTLTQKKKDNVSFTSKTRHNLVIKIIFCYVNF